MRNLGWCWLALLSVACSGGPDEPMDGSAGDGGPVDCATAEAGTPCGAGMVCGGGACVASTCGDGVIDAVSGEDCDDANNVAFDGCTGCRFDCEDNARCDDGDSCTGAGTCDIDTHACVTGTPEATGTACMSTRVASGVCRDVAGTMTCVDPGCGNGVRDGSEDCDDGANGNQDDGCRDDCRFSCAADADCGDGSVCNGDEVCDLASHRCGPGAPLDCDDGDACTADSCDDTTGCASALIDADGDGHAPISLGACGSDCNDANDTVSPDAIELCDGVDNNCDGAIDETAPRWYVDCDRDGFSPTVVDSTMSCTMPIGSPTVCTGPGTWTNLEPMSLTTTDCDDARLEARPGALEICNRGDDDCNGFADEDELAFGTLPVTGTRLGTSPRMVHHASARQLAYLEIVNSGGFGGTRTAELSRGTEDGALIATTTVGSSTNAVDADLVVDGTGYFVAMVMSNDLALRRVDAGSGTTTLLPTYDTGTVTASAVSVARFGSTGDIALLWSNTSTNPQRYSITRVSAATGLEVPGARVDAFLPQVTSTQYVDAKLLTTSDGVVIVAHRWITSPTSVREVIARPYGPSGAGTLTTIGPWNAPYVLDAAYDPENDALVTLENLQVSPPVQLEIGYRALHLATGTVDPRVVVGLFSTTLTNNFLSYSGEPGQVGFFAVPTGADTRPQYTRLRVSDGATVPTPIRLTAGYDDLVLPVLSGPHRLLVFYGTSVGAIDCIP